MGRVSGRSYSYFLCLIVDTDGTGERTEDSMTRNIESCMHVDRVLHDLK
jgi:hypothetical protein